MDEVILAQERERRPPWNKGRVIGQKRPLRQRDIHAIRTRLQIAHNVRETAMFDLALDSKLRGSDLLGLHVRDIWQGNHVLSRTSVTMKKTGCNVRFEITPDTRKEVTAWIEQEHLQPDDCVFPSRHNHKVPLSMRQYTRIVHKWVESAALDSPLYGTHTMRRTKPTLIYRRTKDIRAVQILLGHKRLESTIRYLGVFEEDALSISEQEEL
jgi:site-specific recombinase XerD